MEKQNRSFIRIDEKEITKSPTVEVNTLTSDSTQGRLLKVYTSDNKFVFMVTSPDSPDIPVTFTSKNTSPKIDKAVKKIQTLNAILMPTKSPINFETTPCGTASIQSTPPESIPADNTPNENTPKLTLQTSSKQQLTAEGAPIIPQELERNEEHYNATASPGKS